MPKFQCAIHLLFHFAGTSNSSDEPYDPKMYVQSNWTAPHWTRPSVVLEKRFKKFSLTLDKLFKKMENQTSSHIRHAPCSNYNYNKISSFSPRDKNLLPAIIELHNYIKIAMRDHLLDGRTYQPLSNADCANHKQ